MDTPTVLRLVASYGYPVLGLFILVASAGVPLPVGVALIGLGALTAYTQHLNFAVLALVGIGASISGDLFDYGVGRLGAATFARWLPWLRSLSNPASDSRVVRLWHHHAPGTIVLVTRFLLTPIASPVSVLAGASRVRFLTFLFWDALGESIYVLGYLVLGRVFGIGVGSSTPALIAGTTVVGVLFFAAPFLLTNLRHLWQPGGNGAVKERQAPPASVHDAAPSHGADSNSDDERHLQRTFSA